MSDSKHSIGGARLHPCSRCDEPAAGPFGPDGEWLCTKHTEEAIRDKLARDRDAPAKPRPGPMADKLETK